MNTPKTPKPIVRYTPSFGWPVGTEDQLFYDVSSSDHLKLIGAIVVHFGHLDQEMRRVLSVLIGNTNQFAAGIIFDSIMAPKARITMMQRLLQERPENADLPEDIDQMIDEYGAINKLRNRVVHGLWYSTDVTKQTLRADTDGIGQAVRDAKPVSIKTLKALDTRIRQLTTQIMFWQLERAKRGE